MKFSINRIPKGTKRSSRATTDKIRMKRQAQSDRRDKWGTAETRMANRRKKQEMKNTMREKELDYKKFKLQQRNLSDTIKASGQAVGQAGLGIITPLKTSDYISSSTKSNKSSERLIDQGNDLVTAGSNDDGSYSDER